MNAVPQINTARPPQPETQVVVCPRYPVAKLAHMIPRHFLSTLEQNQQIASCCRHPENHDIEARKSHPDEPAPDIYIFYCTCGRRHPRFMVGNSTRFVWEVR